MGEIKKILDSMYSVGVCVIEKESHTIIYFNPRFQELVPGAEVSLGCYETGLDICERCPLKLYDEKDKTKNIFLRESKVCGGLVEITIDEILWEDEIPAYIISMVPQMEAQETEGYYVHSRAMDEVVSEICEEAVCCNLTKNIYKRFIWSEKGDFCCIGEERVDRLIADLKEKIHPSDVQRFQRIDNVRKMESYFKNGGKCMKDEIRLKNANGKYYWRSCRLIPLNAANGGDVMVAFVLRDIHTRKTLQEQMQHNLAATYKVIPGGVCTLMLDDKLTVISANEEFYDMLGKTAEDYAEGYLKQIHPKDVERVVEHIRVQGAKKENVESTYRAFDGEGGVRWLQVRGLYYGESGGYPIYLLLRTDITLIMEAQKQIEREQAKYQAYTDNVIDTLSNLVEFRDLDSGEHIKRTRELTKILLESYNHKFPEKVFHPKQMEKISRAAALHDVGKIAISDTILNKPGRLTDDEMDIMRTHTTKGYEILRELKLDDDLERRRYSLDIARYHHERWDGRGYPEQLKGDEIPIWSQIVSIVDVYDALVSPRVYKKEFSHEKALQMILDGECGQFNPVLLECLEDSAELLKSRYE